MLQTQRLGHILTPLLYCLILRNYKRVDSAQHLILIFTRDDVQHTIHPRISKTQEIEMFLCWSGHSYSQPRLLTCTIIKANMGPGWDNMSETNCYTVRAFKENKPKEAKQTV